MKILGMLLVALACACQHKAPALDQHKAAAPVLDRAMAANLIQRTEWAHRTSQEDLYYSDPTASIWKPGQLDTSPRRHLLAITGIAVSADGHDADVEFTWDWLGQEDGKRVEDDLMGGVRKEQAKFRLYDDGWRITKGGSR